MNNKLIKSTPTIQQANFFIFSTTKQIRRTHNHEYKELAYIYSGECEHILNEKQTILSEGHFVLLDDTTYHSYRSIGGKKLSIINCLFFPSFIDSSLNDNTDMQTILECDLLNMKKELFKKNPVGTYFKDENGEIKNLLMKIQDEFTRKEAGYIESIRSYLILILIKALRTIYTDTKIFSNDDTVNKIMDYIIINYKNNISLKEICNKYNYSVQYMSYKFKREAGMTFLEYLHKTRIENSMKLLVDTGTSISSISNAVGYKDIKAFYKFFKKYTNTTPAEFRKKSKKFVLYGYGFAKNENPNSDE